MHLLKHILKVRMKTTINVKLSSAIYLSLFLLAMIWGCDPFSKDGITSPEQLSKKGYFYLADRGSNSLIMLDYGMNELKRWPLSAIAPDSAALQGITFNGKNVWLAFSGNEKFIVQVDATDNNLSILHSIPVPPVVSGATKGTVRGIAHDGTNLWVVNSGSASSILSPTLYKLNLSPDSVKASYSIPVTAPRGIAYIPASTSYVYGKGPDAGLYILDNTTKMTTYFNNSVPSFSTSFSAPIPPAGTVYDQTLGITFDGTDFYTLSYSDIGSYLFKTDYTGLVGFSYKLPYQYPVAVVWSNYDIRTINPPTVSSLNPATGAKGTSQSVTVSGTGFKNGTGLKISLGQGITVDTLTYLSATSLYAHVIIDTGAVLGKRSVVVTNPDGMTSAGDSLFTVTPTPVTEYLFVTDYANSMSQIRLSDTATIQTWSTATFSPSSPRGLAYDGTNLWAAVSSSEYKIYKIDMTGATLLGVSSIPCPVASGTVWNLTYHDGSLWLLLSSSIYKLNPSTGAVLDSIAAPSANARGLVFANGVLYSNDRTTKLVYTYDFTTKAWTSVFNEPAPPAGTTSSTGMFFNGTNFWIVNSSTDVQSDVVMEVSLTGTVLRYVKVPNAGAAQPSGIVYIAK